MEYVVRSNIVVVPPLSIAIGTLPFFAASDVDETSVRNSSTLIKSGSLKTGRALPYLDSIMSETPTC